jgi:lipoic acid synthetase
MMIMGEICTRGCTFCNVATGRRRRWTASSPAASRMRWQKLGLKHVVVTSVDRDDLDDGGAAHFAQTIRAIRHRSPDTTIEVLTPDFLKCGPRRWKPWSRRGRTCSTTIWKPCPAFIPRCGPARAISTACGCCSGSRNWTRPCSPNRASWSALAKDRPQVLQVMDDMRAADVDFLTIGQYLQPTPKHHRVARFVTPEEFAGYEKSAWNKGFLMVSATPLTRSSYHAGEDFARMRAARRVSAGVRS